MSLVDASEPALPSNAGVSGTASAPAFPERNSERGLDRHFREQQTCAYLAFARKDIVWASFWTILNTNNMANTDTPQGVQVLGELKMPSPEIHQRG